MSFNKFLHSTPFNYVTISFLEYKIEMESSESTRLGVEWFFYGTKMATRKSGVLEKIHAVVGRISHVAHHLRSFFNAFEITVLCACVCKVGYFDTQIREIFTVQVGELTDLPLLATSWQGTILWNNFHSFVIPSTPLQNIAQISSHPFGPLNQLSLPFLYHTIRPTWASHDLMNISYLHFTFLVRLYKCMGSDYRLPLQRFQRDHWHHSLTSTRVTWTIAPWPNFASYGDLTLD